MTIEKSDHDILIRLDEKVANIETLLKNHLRHHWGITLSLLGITGTAIISILVLILK